MRYSGAHLIRTECSRLLKGGSCLFYSLCFHYNQHMARLLMVHTHTLILSFFLDNRTPVVSGKTYS